MAGQPRMEGDGTRQRALDPFAFFVDQRSALTGLGGCAASTDARYCFHTAYGQVPPGPARFSVNLLGVETVEAELNLRVMALQPGHDALMVASRRLDLVRLRGEDVRSRLAFTASEGVRYALFGFLTEPAEIAARALEVSLRETPPSARGHADGRRLSRFAAAAPASRAAKLVTLRKPCLARPTSQPFDPAQADEAATLGLGNSGGGLAPGDPAQALAAWCAALPLQALLVAGMLAQEGDEPALGVVVGAPDDRLASVLEARGCMLGSSSNEPLADFAVGYLAAAPAERDLGTWSEDARLLFDQLMASLADGGLAIMLLSLGAGPSDAAVLNAIQQIALHAIGQGHGVYQIARDPAFPLCGRGEAGGAFALLARRRIAPARTRQPDTARHVATNHG